MSIFMKKRFTFLKSALIICTFLWGMSGTMSAQVTLILPNSSTANYPSIAAAYAAIDFTTNAGAHVIQLESGYVSSGETYPITFTAKSGASPTNNITVRPASGVTSLSLENTATGGTLYNLTTNAASTVTKITLTSMTGVSSGKMVAGPSIVDQTTITAISGNTITLSTPATNSHAVGNSVYVGTTATAQLTTAVASGATTITLSGAATVNVGDYVTGTASIPAGTTVTGYNSSTKVVTLSAATTAGWSANGVRLYFGPNTAVSTPSTSVNNTISFASVTGLTAGMLVTGAGFSRPIESVDAGINKITLTSGPTQVIANSTPVIVGNPQIRTIVFDGAKYVTIDGQAGGAGQTKNLSISATTTVANASTIGFINDAYKNTVKYCTVLGASASVTSAPVSGTILIGTTTGTTARAGSDPNFTGSGNLYNTIDNCDIAEAASGTLPSVGVYMVGTPTFTNEGNAVTNCNISNYFNAGAFISSGVYVDANSQTSNITGNKLYQSATRTFTGFGLHYPIYINAATKSISDNTIGYNNSTGTGTMTFVGDVAHKCVTMYIKAAVTTLQGNTISDIDYRTASGGNAGEGVFAGIYYTNANMPAATLAKPNKIKNITVRPTNATSANFTLCGISYTYGSGAPAFSYNYIDNLKVLPVNANTTAILFGLYANGSFGATILRNKITNLTCGSAGTAVYTVSGIQSNMNATSSLNAQQNLIYNLNAVSSGASIITGIACTVGTGANKYYNNIISLGNEVTSPAEIRGIYKSATSKDLIYHNSIYIGGSTSGTTANTYAYYRNTTTPTATGEIYKNNIFVNKRSGGTTGKHYAFKLLNAADYSGAYITSTNNIYNVGAGNTLAFIGADVTDYSTLTSSFVNFTTGCVNLDPSAGFISTSTPDLHITSSSPAYNAGVDLSATVTDDFDGDKRITGKKDIGADDISSLNTWTGTTSTDWDVTTNWSNAAKPTATNGSVVIPAGVTNIPVISATNAACNNIILQPGAQLSLNSGKTLTISGNVSLQSDATNGTATLTDANAAGGLTVSGTTTAQQYLTTGRNWYVASPVASATSAVFGAASSATNKLWYYSETTGTSAPWAQITDNSTSLTPGQGYVANMPSSGVVTFSGALNTGALTTATLTRTTGQTGEGFNLVGNPYASYLDWNAVTKTNVMPTMWYRTKVGGTYKFYTYLNGSGALEEDGITVPAGVSNLIPPMQGFWVRVASGQTTGSLSVTNAMRAHKDASGNIMKAPAAKKSALPLLRLQLSDGVNDDETVIYLSQNVSNGLDNFDAAKMLNTGNTVPELYSEVAGEKLAINGLNSENSSKAVALGLKTGTASSFSIRATEIKNMDANTRIVLINNKNNIETDMTDGGVYSFDLDAVNASNPFTVVFRTAGSTTGIDTAKGNNISVLVNAANQIELIAPANIKYGVYNLAGQCMVNGVTTSNRSIVNSKFAAGVYMVKVAGEQTKRVSIK